MTAPRLFVALTLAATALVATAAGSTPAAAQIAGVVTRPRGPRISRAARDSAARDSTVGVGRTAAKVPAEERQRLDIQAWVDSAAGALATTPPAPIPAPGPGSIFDSASAVPDSLRVPAVPRPARRARSTSRRRRPTALVPRGAPAVLAAEPASPAGVPSAARDVPLSRLDRPRALGQ